MKEWSYLNSAVQILEIYKGSEPFSSFLKKFFAERKKYGSKDRRLISHLCYCYFRLGKLQEGFLVKDRVLAGLFFCSSEPDQILNALKPEWNNAVSLSLPDKFSMLNLKYSSVDIFPWEDELSTEIDPEKFTNSFFIQPDLFLRLRPRKENIVKQKLEKAGVNFKVIGNECIGLLNSVKLADIIAMNKEAVVQDYNSQRVGSLLPLGIGDRPITVWDCCAASGGKSIMAKDILGDIALTVSDIRESILINLKKRFSEAGFKNYKLFVADLAAPNLQLPVSNFNIIICDAPCTGSGTWSRTPEQLFYFDKRQVDRYSSLQRQIISNTVPHLEAGGWFLYITCSVFKKENEEVVTFLQHNFQLKLEKMETLKGYDKKADTMFAALLRKPL